MSARTPAHAARIAYLGPPGTYSHESCLRRYGRAVTLLPHANFDDVLSALEGASRGRADAALLPVENSIEGPVTQSLDQLARHAHLAIVESFCMAIRNCLLARPGLALGGIGCVYSHPQALAQSRQWLARHLPGARIIAAASTAEAARLAAAEPAAAAIAGELAGRLHGLRALALDTQDHAANTTRFVVVRRQQATAKAVAPRAGDEQRAMLHVVLPNRPGALLHALQPFQTANLNLTFIQSRPLAGRPWEYGFFIEVQISGHERAFQSVLDFLGAFMERCQLLGRYKFSRQPLR
ncbi:MAG: prephenate dehydratase [Kiritimatiellae bacterium]|nr:prephenate dehydratase [Kiritimatiellia bacterium]